MSIEFTRSLWQPMILDAQSIQNINAELTTFFESIEYKVKCEDNVTRKFTGVNMLLEYENSKSKKVSGLTISCDGPENCYFVLDFISCKTSTMVVIARGEENRINNAYQKCLGFIDNAHPWYIAFTFNELVFNWKNIFTQISISIAIIFIALRLGLPVDYFTNKPIEFFFVLSFLYLMSVLIFLEVKELIIDRLFPSVYFKIGKGVDRYQILENTRWVVLGTILSIIVGFIFSPFL